MPTTRTTSRPTAPSAGTGLPSRRAFSLVELTVVLGLIILLITLAVPALSLITGSRSIDGGINVLSAVVARARMEAISAQEPRGVVLIRSRVDDRRAVGIIGRPAAPDWNSTTFYRAGDCVTQSGTGNLFIATTDVSGGALPGAVWEPVPNTVVDLLPGSELTNLPPGVDCQVIDEPRATVTPFAENDRLLTTGVLWFDANGRAVRGDWALSMYGRAGQSAGSSLISSLPLNYYFDAGSLPFVAGTSGQGVVVFDRTLFAAEDRDDADLELGQKPGAYAGSPEEREENWVFANGIPLLVNRYNGTLVRAQ